MADYHIQPVAGPIASDGNMFYRRAGLSSQPLSSGSVLLDAPAAQRTAKDKLILERHFNDLYAVFLHKMTTFALQSDFSSQEVERLRAFFDELLKARELLGE